MRLEKLRKYDVFYPNYAPHALYLWLGNDIEDEVTHIDLRSKEELCVGFENRDIEVSVCNTSLGTAFAIYMEE